jgi:Ca2+-binding EF-hand superfamily protein
MYQRNNQDLPTFILIKNAYDTLDLRKDGIIDIKEWCISFASYNGKLDVNSEKVPNGPEFFNSQLQSIKDNNIKNKIHNRINLREWETSSDITDLYLLIYKNRKLIKEKIFQSNCILNGSGDTLVQADNLLNIIRDLLPNNNLSQTQWKMIVSIAQNESNNNMIDIDKFFRLMEITSKHLMSHPKIRISKSVGDFSGLINDKSKKSIEINHLKMRKYNNANNINKQKANSVNLVNFGNVVLPNELKGKKPK